MLIRFLVLVLTVVAVAVVAFVTESTWAVVGAVVVLIVLLFESLRLLGRRLSDEPQSAPERAPETESTTIDTYQPPRRPDPPEGRRVLVLAGAAVESLDAVPPEVHSVLQSADHVFVAAPALPSKARWMVSDVDRAREEADYRLQTILAQLREAGVPAEGAVADDTPLVAAQDHASAFAPQHLIIALRSGEQAGWQERGLIEDIERALHIPATVFEVLHPAR